MYYYHQEFDFVYRTKQIIEQYEKFNIDNHEKFEVTLLINCLVGLLIIPNQHWFNKLPETEISEVEWGINLDQILFIRHGETKNVKVVATHLRNSISHYHFKLLALNDINIDEIELSDYLPMNRGGALTFHTSMPITSLWKFADRLSQEFLAAMKHDKDINEQ